MLIVNYDPIEGWSTPEIKPYSPLTLDPMASCFQYCPNVFEGMKVRVFNFRLEQILTISKAYAGPDGGPRLFRPKDNMARLARSVERVALPVGRITFLLLATTYSHLLQPFDTNQLLILIQKLVRIESRWIPDLPGYSLYIRPTVIGTRAGTPRCSPSSLFSIMLITFP